MRRSTVLVACAALAAALAIAVQPADRRWQRSGSRSVATALLGPLANVAASIQWVRVDVAFAAGEPARGFALAERALELDPGATDGWHTLVWYQAMQLASPAREPDGERRRRWLENGLAVARRGEERARDPAALALLAGDVLFVHAGHELPTPWPGGQVAMLELAAENYERAAKAGNATATISLAEVRRRLETSRSKP